MVLALATLAALLSLAVAAASVAAWRASAAEALRLRREARAMADRLQAAERLAAQASARADNASRLLLAKGIAAEGELESGDADDQGAGRGGRTVH